MTNIKEGYFLFSIIVREFLLALISFHLTYRYTVQPHCLWWAPKRSERLRTYAELFLQSVYLVNDFL